MQLLEHGQESLSVALERIAWQAFVQFEHEFNTKIIQLVRFLSFENLIYLIHLKYINSKSVLNLLKMIYFTFEIF